MKKICQEALIPFHNICGFSKGQSRFDGQTFLRFPLRTKASKLSNEVYTIDKLRKLLKPLKEEAKYLLLFLRSVYSIEVFEISSNNSVECIFKVSIDSFDYQQRIKQQKQQFVSNVESRFTSESLYNTDHVITDAANFSIKIVDDDSCYEHKWLVVNQVGSNEEDVLELAQRQHVLPWVGVAIETNTEQIDSNGRIFCVLPLPMEDRAPLSVHINGTFAVSSNRRSLKWESQERKDDKESKWNGFLVKKCLPTCLVELVIQLIELYDNAPSVVYDCWPDIERVKGTPWESILEPFYHSLLHCSRVVYTPNAGGNWISISDSVFVKDRCIPQPVQDAVISCQVNLVKLSDKCYNVLQQYYGKISELTPALVRQYLKQKIDSYRSMPVRDKLIILHYCLIDDAYHDLIGLELLPTVDSNFCQFKSPNISSTIDNVYVCTESFPSILLPELQHILVSMYNSDSLLHTKLTKVATNKCTQLKMLNVPLIADLLQYCNTSSWSNDQMSCFWKWLYNQPLQYFHEKMIVPVKLDTGCTVIKSLDKQNGVVYVSSFSHLTVLMSALIKCNIMFANVSDFSFLVHSQLNKYLNHFIPDDVLDALQYCSLGNVSLPIEEAKSIQEFLSSSNNIMDRSDVVCSIPMFSVIQSNMLYSRSINALRSNYANNRAIFVKFSYRFEQTQLPIDPLLLSPQANNETLLLKLQSDVQLMSEIDYFEKILSVSVRSNPKVYSRLMLSILNQFELLRHANSSHRFQQFVDALSNLPFIEDSSYNFQAPQNLFDPEIKLIKELYRGQVKFPNSNYKSYLPVLRQCGLKTSITATDLLEIVQNIQQVSSQHIAHSNETNFRRSIAVLQYLIDNPSTLNHSVQVNTSLINSLFNNESCWLPVVCNPPQQYPSCLTWKGSSYPQALVSPCYTPLVALSKDITCSQLPMIAGSCTIFIEHVPNQIAQCICSLPKDIVKAVISHFKDVIYNKDNISLDMLEELVFQTYSYLQNNISYCDTNVFSETEKWIWLEKYSKFVSPIQVVITPCPSFRASLEPFQFILSSRWQRFSQLFTKLRVPQELTVQNVLYSIKQNSTVVSSDVAWSIVKSVLDWIVEDCLRISGSVLVPVESDSEYPDLQPIDSVAYTDNDILREIASASDENYFIIHPKVAYLAPPLGLIPLSDQLDITEDVFEDAGQHEPLTTRLRNILKDYKDGLTIIKEMIQNADDAEATEVNILYDTRTHTTENLILKGMADSHGPALIVHNNSTFSDEDFKNITKLAGATKSDKPLRIGKFGVGFCSVYHITDVPSFVSGEWLYIFDPTLQYLKGVVRNENQPGKKMKYMSKFLARSNQLAPYKNLFGFSSSKLYNGTMFRFPFRTNPSEISSTHYNEHLISQLKKDIANNGSKLLLFLQNVKKITFSSIQNNELVIELSIECITDGDLIKCITKSIDSEDTVEYWLISSHNQMLTQNNKTVPATASVACQLSIDELSNTFVCKNIGQLFCFLPLSVPSTGLPVHVSANFAVMSNRSGIWTTSSSEITSDPREHWNQSLMTSVVPYCYCNLLLKVKEMYLNGQISSYEFYSLWPLDVLLQTKYPWLTLNSNLYKLIFQNKLLYSTSLRQWLTLSESRFLSQSLSTGCELLHDDITCIHKAVTCLKLPVVFLPQLYLQQIQTTISPHSISYIEQVDFTSLFLSNISHFITDIDNRNKVLLHILSWVIMEQDCNSKLQELLKQYPCIPCCPNDVTLKLASQLIDPNVYNDMFDSNDEMFPVNSFIENTLIYQAMIKLGLLRSSIPPSIIISSARTVQSLFSQNRESGLQRIKLLIKCIEESHQYFASNVEICLLKKIPFLPVLPKPENYILPWKGDGHLLLPASQLVTGSRKYAVTVGSQRAIVDTRRDYGCGSIAIKVLSLLDIPTRPSLDDVLKNFECLIDIFNKRNDAEVVKQICHCVYEYLNNELQSQKQISESGRRALKLPRLQDTVSTAEERLSVYTDKPFIWTGSCFAVPCDVAINWKRNYSPYLYKLPDILSQQTLLLDVLKIKDDFTIHKLLAVFSTMKGNVDTKQVPPNYHCLCDDIILELSKFSVISEELNDVVLVDQDYVLRSAKHLSYNDAPWLPAVATDGCHFVHPKLNRDVAVKLGVVPTKTKFLDSFTSHSEHFQGVPFGQREELTDRIKNILRDYPLDVTLLKEFIQNADDAKATKMCVILDTRYHKRKRVLSEEWKELQGPALLVWNDKDFTDEDLKGIQKLGIGSKRDDDESIGQFGIGFNVVYHITDCPSFITHGNILCVFDPHCRYVPGANPLCPGRQYDRLDQLFWSSMSDLHTTYLLDNLPNKPPGLNSGVLFRFPLRCTEEQVLNSKLVNEPVDVLTAKVMEQYLDNWMPSIKDALIFLNNITQFEFYVINEKSEFICKTSLSVCLSERNIQKRSSMKQVFSEFKRSKQCQQIMYPLTIKSNGPLEKEEHWLIQQGVGDMNDPTKEWIFLKHTLPKYGIAAPLHKPQTLNGQVFCFLPLPEYTRLSVHINGQFALTSNRRSLWNSTTDEADNKTKWNNDLIKAIAYSYAKFLCEARQYYISNERYKSSEQFYNAVDSYYSLFPFWKGEDKHRSIDWKGIGSMVFEYLWSINAPVLVSEIDHSKFISAQWYILHNEINPNQQAYFLPKTRLGKVLQKILRSIGMILTCAPYTLYVHLKEHKPAIINEKSVYIYYKNFHHLVIATCPFSIQNTPFQSPQTFCLFLKYLLVKYTQDDTIQYKFPDDDVPIDTPLLLTADSQLRAFSNSKQTLHSSYCSLFLQSSSMFLHSSLLTICPKNYFVSKENISYEEIDKIILSNYPQDLHQLDVVNNTNSYIINIEVLKQLWECFHYDPVFSFHKNDIVNSWAIIPSCCGKLYRSSSKILPVVSQKPIEHQIYQDAFEVITSLGVPKLNPDFEEYASNYCIEVTDCVGILSVLYHLHIQQNVLCNLTNPTQTILTLFKYFSRISFRNDDKSLTYIKSLPLFETVNNDKLTSIVGKSLYLEPLDFCMSGIEKWAPPTQIVFLKRNGRWKELCDFETLGGKELNEIYTMIIFAKFCELTAKERKEHLQYIRDNLYDDVSLDMQYTYRSKILSELKCLPCVESQDGVLQRASFFSNHKIPIFQSFPHHFHFLPDDFDDDKWIKFFCFLGLRQTVTLEEFKIFCREISVGNHQSIAHASNVLVEHLFLKSAKGWHANTLSEIGNICFVVVDPLRGLQWIKESCQPPHYFQSQNVGLTKLNEAVIYDSASIVWTIKPVVSLPYPYPLVFRSKDEYNDTLGKLGVTIKPSVEDVYQNLINVSKTGLADFSLFENRPDYVRKGDDNEQVSIKDVIKQSLNYLFENKANNYLRQLAAVPCIPVSAYSASYGDIDKPVLVKPLQVVKHISEKYQSLFPYVHKLPSFMNALNDGNVDLELIGVSESITIKTMQHMLEFMYQQYSNSQFDPNNIRRVKKAILKIHELCKDSTAVHDIAPLYYPNEAHQLIETTKLYFIDSDRYKNLTFLKSKYTYSLFQLPKESKKSHEPEQLPNEKDICLLLPKEVRPQGISLVCTEEIANNSEYSRDCPLSIHFQNLKLIAPSMHELMCKVLAGTVENVTEFCTSFLDLIIQMDICVRPHLMCNIKVDSCLIDTIKVPYILQQAQENNYILYVDSKNTFTSFLKSNLAHSLCVEIAHSHCVKCTTYLKAVHIVKKLLGIQCQNGLSEIFKKYNIKDQHIEIQLQSDSTPVPGKVIPEGLRALLYEGDINHIFTPEEWVGYEISEGVIIFAIVLYPLLSKDMNDPLTFKYKILINDSEAGEIEVTALDLYKFKVPKFITESDSRELVPSDSSSASAELKTLTDSHTLIELKKKICSELKLIWRLQDEKEKTKGIKRLYLKYHPDKADPSMTHIYEEAFKFLKRQIDRLDNNLPLEDPDNTLDEHEPVSGWTSYYPRWECYVPRSSSRQKSNTTNHHDENRSENPWKTFFTQYQPTSNTETSKQWLKQAESDMTAMNLLKESPPSYKVHCQVLFLAHEVCEKALKAGMYALVGLNPSSLKTHELDTHANAISSQKGDKWAQLPQLVRHMEQYYLNARFPNRHMNSKAPVDVYTSSTAQEMASNANEVFELIAEFIRN